MQEERLKAYVDMIRSYYHLLKSLYVQLEHQIQLKRFTHNNIDITPQGKTISQQIQHWHQNVFLFPPTAWVEPRKGSMIINDQQWTYTFHGTGLSFFHEEAKLDVSAEFSRLGQVAITQHTAWCYISTYPNALPLWPQLASLNEIYFKEIAAREYITAVAPLYADDEQTYIVNYLPDV